MQIGYSQDLVCRSEQQEEPRQSDVAGTATFHVLRLCPLKAIFFASKSADSKLKMFFFKYLLGDFYFLFFCASCLWFGRRCPGTRGTRALTLTRDHCHKFSFLRQLQQTNTTGSWKDAALSVRINACSDVCSLFLIRVLSKIITALSITSVEFLCIQKQNLQAAITRYG